MIRERLTPQAVEFQVDLIPLLKVWLFLNLEQCLNLQLLADNFMYDARFDCLHEFL